MVAIMGFLSMLGFAVAFCGLIYSAIKKKPLKNWGVGAGVCFVLFIAAIIITPPPSKDSSSDKVQVTREEVQAAQKRLDDEAKQKELVKQTQAKSEEKPATTTAPATKKSDTPLSTPVAAPTPPVTAKENNFNKHEDVAPKSTLRYVGNASSLKFHTSGCRAERKIKSGNRVDFSSADEARNAGYSPCGICKPR